ncbi:deoxyribose-phosphate aldolase [Capnocytophaga catalasegens]|uniref:Deoxyribose-phosphate aldolase n=1 Tax=Capnocytophaga catalasegens TaxID=1004260 RepID=A0AAV5AXY6_9FLAO|nr:deoxyribose-phosphate aldolase [Capnocytophaga catalasegens]GIZ14604.1 deoxyribose-phosphate aldolase [Capnocytophaga catalasegens]GJM50806.1 deoxyribose-phosphate aldolase [Capnocytophaga catalasegens]GJM51959.1 deoxyribose-phosphate aldolase [Capnocytophaga catalasegens]
MRLEKYIDHTLLKPTATSLDIEKLCNEAMEYKFFSVCVNSCYVPLAAELLRNSDVSVCSVVGFPLGAMSTRAKLFEAERALTDGADEIDMVLNIGWLKSKRINEVLQEISFIKNETGKRILKVILETCYLDETEKKLACKLCVDAGADFVKTSTGFGSAGATFEDVKLMKNAVKGDAKVKASGGIRDRQTAMDYIYLGVDRIGTSNGIAIVTGDSSVQSGY